jgi:antitoxin VapB
MNLQIRDPRAHDLARRLAEKQKTSMTEAVIAALEAQLAEHESRPPLADRVAEIAHGLKASSQGRGHDMSKDEVDRMWGHE